MPKKIVPIRDSNKPYNPQEIESKIYELWEKSGFFNPDKLPTKKPEKSKTKSFTIIMPPPNANEALHVGHALTMILEDIMVRFNRMRGKKTLWLPGSDHAGFETQVVFEKKLEKEGKSRFDFDRDALYKMIWDYVQSNKHTMESQTRAFGASCDWSREKFTLDPRIVEIVYDTFKKLHDDGLVYRGKRVINWCPKHQTSFSELEVKYEEKESTLWFIKYPLKDNGFITVATTRPETMLGDTAVAVNPKDKRYKSLIGKKVKLPLTNREITIVEDNAVEIDFGTGAVKVTPAHDQTDFEISQRHNLEILEVIGKDGKMTNIVPGAYRGLKAIEAREKIVADLKNLGLIEKEEPYKHTVGSCYKCGRIIEPMLSEQWFVKIRPLADKAVAAVKNGQTKFVSKKYEKIFLHWMKILHDWNISRQIVWGIRIPVWYCNTEKSCFVISDKKPDKCSKCNSTDFYPEIDTFDTWFSSAQWPFATLMASQPNDFKTYYPTSVMETGWDILPFWVIRMLMIGIYVTGEVPFKYVYLHGMIRDKDKQKMSKSKGNVVNPIGLIEERGADALRMSLVFSAESDSDISFSDDKLIAQQRFVNKIWNASKFVLANLGDDFDPNKIKSAGQRTEYTKEDKWILKELEKSKKKITTDIEKFKFHEAAQEAYHFFWHKFCDKTIEDVKMRIQNDSKDADTGRLVLWTILYGSLKFLHPFMPFITEEIYQQLPIKNKKLLLVEKW